MIVFARNDGAQAIIAVALAIAVVLVAIAVGLDWTYGLAQRRAMQNAADAAALAGARMLASSVILRGTAVAFNSSAETVYCEARRFAEANLGYARDPSTLTLTIEFANSVTPTVWRPVSAATCPTTGSTPVASDTVFVRATVRTTVPAIGARIVGITSLDTSAAARAQISGAAPPLLPTLPVIREFDPSLVSCAQCQPGALTPVTVWANNDETSTQHSFKGLVDYSRYSSRQAPDAVEQLVTQWDKSGSVDAGTPLKPDLSGKCPGTAWDTEGGEDPNQQNRQCSGVNWLSYLFHGVLSTTTDWSRARGPGQVVPSNLSPSRSVCQSGTRPAFAPSCDPGAGRLGDWVETITQGGGSDIPRYLSQLIAAQGVITPLSSRPVPGGGQLHGKAVSLELFLWDCAETYTGNGKWSLINVNGDCSRTFAPGDPTPDRVHLFTVVSYSVYEGLVASNQVQGYFSGVLVDPTTCRTCSINPFANSVSLIGDP